MRRDRQRERDDAGQASVELALALPVVLVLLLAVVQVGLVVRDHVLVTHAAREAARAAAVDPSDTAALAAARLAAPDLDPRTLTVETSGREGPGSHVRVTVTYVRETRVPLVGRLFGPVTLRAQAAMRVEV